MSILVNNNPFFISVEGPIGIGKTSLSQIIADEYSFHFLKEIVEENPFLDKFYDDITEWSFQTEMFFLCNRYKQLDDIQQHYLLHQLPVVADYHIFKNKIFAQRTLSDENHQKYNQIFDILMKDKPQPNVIIYLHASLDTIMTRIEKRGRAMEKTIKASYIEQLSDDYDVFMKDFETKNTNAKILKYNGDYLNFVDSAEDLKYILHDINRIVGC